MIHRRDLVLALAALPLAAVATAPGLPAEVAAEIPGARLIGATRLRFLGLSVYDIRLWSDSAKATTEPLSTVLALELEYARSLSGAQIAERSLQEMLGIDSSAAAQADSWLARLRKIIPDVKKGDRITGVQRPGESTLFFINGALKDEVRDAGFTRQFFGIWLSPRTSQPKLREALLGGKGIES